MKSHKKDLNEGSDGGQKLQKNILVEHSVESKDGLKQRSHLNGLNEESDGG